MVKMIIKSIFWYSGYLILLKQCIHIICIRLFLYMRTCNN